MAELWNETLGDPRIRIAVLDGPVDVSALNFAGATLTHLETLVVRAAAPSQLSLRDQDRYLWAKNFVDQLEDEIQRSFELPSS